MSKRSRSRSPLSSKSAMKDNDTPEKKVAKNCMTLHVTNIPIHWDFKEITAFVRGKTGDYSEQGFFLINGIRDGQKNFTGEFLFIFRNIEACHKALKELQGAECEGKTIKAQLDIDGSITKNAAKNRKKRFASDFTKNPMNANSKSVGYMPPETLSDNTYGLSQQCLHALDIQPPLRRKVFVQNLYKSVTEEKLREVFSLAGQVISVNLFPPKEDVPGTSAIIEYDHPVEAVQAISMLNEQKLNGRPMFVKMDRKPNCNRRLPIGLDSVGPGLGKNGEPMIGVRVSVELKPIKERLHWVEKAVYDRKSNQNNSNAGNSNSFQPDQPTQPNNLLTQLSAILSNQAANQGIPTNSTNSLALQSPNIQNQVQNVPNFGQNVSNFGQNVPNYEKNTVNFGQNASIFGQNASNFGQNAPNFEQNVLNTNFSNTVQQHSAAIGQGGNFTQTSMQQNIPSFSQNMVQSQSDWNTQSSNVSNIQQQYGTDGNFYMQQSSFNDGSRDFDTKFQKNNMDFGKVQQDSNNTSGLLVFSYLPPSVTGEALSMKMAEIGELEFAEVTGKGRAIVRFKNSIDAEKCIELFDRSKVDGQIINVKFL